MSHQSNYERHQQWQRNADAAAEAGDFAAQSLWLAARRGRAKAVAWAEAEEARVANERAYWDETE